MQRTEHQVIAEVRMCRDEPTRCESAVCESARCGSSGDVVAADAVHSLKTMGAQALIAAPFERVPRANKKGRKPCGISGLIGTMMVR